MDVTLFYSLYFDAACGCTVACQMENPGCSRNRGFLNRNLKRQFPIKFYPQFGKLGFVWQFCTGVVLLPRDATTGTTIAGITAKIPKAITVPLPM